MEDFITLYGAEYYNATSCVFFFFLINLQLYYIFTYKRGGHKYLAGCDIGQFWRNDYLEKNLI